MTPEIKNTLIREAKRLTSGWPKDQAKAYKRAMIKINKDNRWDGVYENIYRPEISLITEERKILNDWIGAWKPAFPGRVTVAVRGSLYG